MLKLKRVEIQGFKSFYDRTEMKFHGSGIAAVVGPNGCGKSNLSDAISWVLGEQSAKSLRGARMEDVIFAGTREKKPLGMASVMLTLVGDDQAPPLFPGSESTNGHASHEMERTGEITITRRLYRSGESEYLINGKLARLRDIQDLFLGTGLGPESYAIIEQGRIGQILSNRPQDRRNVIEEAAGITKFKTRKRLAEAKLESAKQNLARVFDILEEVTRQVNSLKRQAAKTKRYAELKAQATSQLRQLLAAKFRMMERETAKIAIELNFASAELQEKQTAIHEQEIQQTQVLEASYATDRELTQARKLLADLQLEAERARGQLEYQAKQIQQIDQRLASGQQEALALQKQHQEKIVDLDQQTSELEAHESRCAEARQALEAKSLGRQNAQNSLVEHERLLEQIRQRVLRLFGESSTLKNRITQLEEQLAAADRQSSRARAEERQSESEVVRLSEVQAQLSERLAVRQLELTSLAGQRHSLEQELQHKREKLNENRQALDRVRGEFSRLKARKDSLEEVLQHRSYTTETVKRLFTAVEHGRAFDLQPVGVLADFLEVDPQLEKATEEFLHDELEYVVVRDWKDAERGVELMRTDLNGRATFVVESTGEEKNEDPELPELAAESGILAKLTDALRFTNGLTNVPLQTLPRIANCYVVSDRTLARDLAEQFPQCWFLAADGVNYHGHAVSGGKKNGAGPLALKRELRELSQAEQIKGTELETAQAHVSELERSIAAVTEQLESLRARQQAQEKDVLALDHETRKVAEEFDRFQTSLANSRLELDALSRQQVTLEASLDRDRNALEASDQLRAEEEWTFESAREQLTDLQAEVARAGEEHATVRANLATLEERRQSLRANQARLESLVRDLADRQAQLAREAQQFADERAEFAASNALLDAKGAELRSSILSTEVAEKDLAAQESELRARLASLDEQLKRLRTEAQLTQERRSDLQVSLARAESDLKHLEETCEQELQTSLAQLADGMETVEDEATLQRIDADYAEVLRKIEALGPVNPQALEEFEEAQQRQDFLNTQRQDLLDSIRDTEKAIHEIDGESRKRFTEAFQAINANFREMFNVLFGGGVGEMRLTDEDNVAESGIDIVASPPGKKLQSVLLLSGGEKSLTAMALLMAIFQYTPSPFCILDEVDAPLDEPNIDRLTRLLKEMSDQTQFIVITHAKATMEAAQALYGVTMQEPGISKLVSVRFKPAEGRQKQIQPKIEEDLEPAIA